MNIKELIYAEIGNIQEDKLQELYEIVKDFSQSQSTETTSLFGKLKSIKIQGPVDFATNIDSYLNGEKNINDD